MELKVAWGTSGPLSRWSETGGVSLRWGSGAASEGRTFEEDLALLEGQVLAEQFDKSRPVIASSGSSTSDGRRSRLEDTNARLTDV